MVFWFGRDFLAKILNHAIQCLQSKNKGLPEYVGMRQPCTKCVQGHKNKIAGRCRGGGGG